MHKSEFVQENDTHNILWDTSGSFNLGHATRSSDSPQKEKKKKRKKKEKENQLNSGLCRSD